MTHILDFLESIFPVDDWGALLLCVIWALFTLWLLSEVDWRKF